MKLINSEDIDRVWENNKEILKNSAKRRLGVCDLKLHKPWLHEVCLRF